MVEVANVHAPYLVPPAGLERHLLLLLGTAGFVPQAVYVLFDPLLEGSVDGGTAGFEVAGDAFHVPSLGVKRHSGEPALYDALCLMVGLEATEHPYGRGIRF